MPQLTIQQAFDLAVQHHQSGQLQQAEQLYRQILAQQPQHAEALHRLGLLAHQLGRNDIAIDLLRQSIVVNPNSPETHNALGLALRANQQPDEAVAAFRQAVALAPNSSKALNNLGIALRDQKQLDAAIATFCQALTLNPNYPEAHNNLGVTLRDNEQFDDAIAAYQKAIALKPTFPEPYCNLGSAFKSRGQLDEAIAAFRQALILKPNYMEANSNLLYTLHFHPACDNQTLGEEHRRWNHQHAQPLQSLIHPHSNDRSPARRLRIGYVSPDFREHVIARFLLPLLAHHDHHHFEIFAYAQVPTPDAVTQELRTHTDHWRSLIGLSDDQAAQLIRNDQIDILIDLTMHMAGNRLLLFGRKPAPIQLTYLAYCSTTGLSTIDYRLSDPHLDPPTQDLSVYTEKTLHLRDTYWCYQPISVPLITPLPALTANHITFGSLNNFCKITGPTLTTWADLLHAVPNSRLLLHAPEGQARQRIIDFFQRSEVAPQRLLFSHRLPVSDYLHLYDQIDIALDPFPYGGGTTTCDALWMGVPVITLAGKTAVGRGGVSILSNLHLPYLIAQTPDQYIQIAATLANDLPRLSALRSTLRERMQKSPVMDAPRFTRNVESIYRQIWQKWCTPLSPQLRTS